MKKKIVLFLAILLTASLNSIASSTEANLEAFYKYLGSRIKYPVQANQNNLQGKSQLLFTLKDGKLSDVSIKNELGGGCDVEVLNTVLSYPNLKSLKNGQYALITTFKLDGATTPIKNQDLEAPEGYAELKLTIIGFASAKQKVNVQGHGNNSFKVSYQGNGIILKGNNGNEPKVILDSTEVDYTFMKTIDPNHIESIQILKGESAIAAYGPSAITGVIIINTKNTLPKLTPAKEQKKQE